MRKAITLRAAPQAQPESLPSSRYFDSRAGGSWASDRMSFEEMAQQRRGVAMPAAVPAPREGDQFAWGSQAPADDMVSQPFAGGTSDKSKGQCGISDHRVRCPLASLCMNYGKGSVLCVEREPVGAAAGWSPLSWRS